MDHVAPPLNPDGDEIDVPLLSLQNYDHLDFLGYPQREGWGVRSVLDWDDLFENPPREFQAFLQRWLYFGVLEVVFRQRINVLDFVRWKDNDSQPYLCSRDLINYTEKFASTADIDVLVKAFQIQANMVDTRNSGLEKRTHPKYARDYPPLSKYTLLASKASPQVPEVTMATDSMIDFVLNACMDLVVRTIMNEPDRMLLPQHGRLLEFPFKKLTWKLLRNQGWCPSQLGMMFERYNTAGLYYMSRIQRPDKPRQHKTDRISPHGYDDISHEPSAKDQVCSLWKCSYRNLQENSYMTAHVNGCPGCREIEVQQEDLADILRKGTFPLILSIDDDENPENIQVLPWEDGLAYIAISHVWSDGLGNVHKNAIPRCQLVRLSNLVRTLSGKASDVILFWLDTICVPPDAANQPELQQLAIEKMRETYLYSCATLVVDAELYSISTVGMSDAEIMMRVFVSTWNSRLWTYQEGALPSALYFQFEEAAHDVDELLERFQQSEDFATKYTLGNRLSREYFALRGFRNLSGVSGGQGPIDGVLLFMIHALSHRTTSVPSDEAICLSTLLGLDMRAIVETKPEQRMEKFWTMIPKIPWSILQDGGPKLDVPGLRWAPKSLLFTPERRHPFTGNHAPLLAMNHGVKIQRTDEGLNFKAPGVVIACFNYRVGHVLSAIDSTGVYHKFIDVAADLHVKTRSSWIPDGEKRYEHPSCVHPRGIHPGGKIAFVFAEEEWPPEKGRSHMCVFVVIKEQRSGINYATKVGTGFYLGALEKDSPCGALRALRPPPYFGFKGGPAAIDTMENQVLSASWAYVEPPGQKWCII